VVYVLISVLVVFMVLFAKIMLSPELKYHSFWYKLKSKLFFFIGDFRTISSLPFVSTEIKEHFKIHFSDIREGDLLSKPGDVGLHRIKGAWSNAGIPGAFKHAWIVVDGNKCVEACSDGVVLRDALYPLATDYAVILRPKDVSEKDIEMAIKRSKAIVGCHYDANFKFDLEEANDMIEVRDLGRYRSNISAGAFHPAFSCTETVGFSWFHKRSALRLFRTSYAGRDAIVADDFLKMNFDVVWASPNLTEKWLVARGLHEEGRRKILEWLKDHSTHDGKG